MSETQHMDVTEYHEQTKHRFTGLARGPDTLDWDAQPDAFRRFAGAPLTRLPLAADALSLPYSALYEATPVPAQPMGVDSIGMLLEISLALSAWKQYGSSRWALRCNPSSGNLHPTEAYLIPLGIDALEDGVYHYRADEHGLEQRCRLINNDGPSSSGLWLGLSSVHWREAWKYGERAFRYCQLDVGHAVAALSYAAATLGWHLTPHSDVSDAQLAHLLGIDRSADYGKAEPEHPDLLVSIHPAGSEPVDVEPLLQRLQQADWAGQANVLDRRHFYRWPIIDQVAEAAHKPAQGGPGRAQYDNLPAPLPSPCATPAARLFRQRRSAQAFDGETAMSQADFFRTLDHLLPRPGVAPWDSQPWPARIHPVLFVHRVEGVEPGLYALPRRTEALPMLKAAMQAAFAWSTVEGAPPHLPLYRLMEGRMQGTAVKLSCGQGIAGHSAFSLAMLAEFEENVTDAPWRYRELHWEAGAVGQVLYLEAEASGLRGTGIGCFFDDGVHELLGIAGGKLQTLYHFTVGGPLTDDRIVSLPPYSTGR